MKKLLVTASTFPRWIDDTEPRFVLDLCIKLTKYFDVTVLVPMALGAKESEILEGVKVIRYHYFPIHRLETLCYPGAIVPRIREKKSRIVLVPFLFIVLYVNLFKLLPKFDVVHAHWLIPQGIMQSFFHKPYIVTGHGGDVTSLNGGLIKKLKKRCLNRANAVTVVSEHLKAEVQKLYDFKGIEVISMGCNLHNFGKQYYQPNYFKQEGKKVILFVGRLAEKKGVTYLIQAMQSIDAVLVIVGDGFLKRVLMEQAKGMGNKVRFWGSKTHEELKVIYASADILAVPSVTAKDGDMEGVPTVIMEAMASGLPIVATKSGGITNIIEDGKTGLLCEEKSVFQLIDKICALLDDEKLCKKISKAAFNNASIFDYDEISQKYYNIIEGIY